MFLKRFSRYISMFLLLFICSGNILAKQHPLNVITCLIVNDGYIPEAPMLLESKSVRLSVKPGVEKTIFQSEKLTIRLLSGAITTLDSQPPWASTFKISVLQPQENTVTVSSSPRLNDKQKMNIHLVISKPEVDGGELIIECSASQ